MDRDTVLLRADGALGAVLREALAGRRVVAEPEPAAAAVYAVRDPASEGGAQLAREPAEALRFGIAALDALRSGGCLVYVVRSFASIRATAAFGEASAVGAAVVAVARCLAGSCVGHDVRVNTLALGVLDTPGDDVLAAALGQTPARRVRVEEAGEALAFLLSPASSALNGAVLAADATLSARL